MPDIRIEVPVHIMDNARDKDRLLDTITSKVRISILSTMKMLIPDCTLELGDMWTRTSVTKSSASVIYIDITMLKSPERTPEVVKTIADRIKEGLALMTASNNALMGAGVLVWMHMKDVGEYAEHEP